MATAHDNLGSVYRLMGRHREAAVTLREAIAIFQGLAGAEHPVVAIATNNPGKTLFDQGRIPEAETTLLAARDLAGRVFPAGHVNVAVIAAARD